MTPLARNSSAFPLVRKTSVYDPKGIATIRERDLNDARPKTLQWLGYIGLSAFRYALLIGTDVWVVHAFQKKSTHGIKTPKHEIDLISTRVKRLKEMLR